MHRVLQQGPCLNVRCGTSQLYRNKHAQKQHALTANSDAYARCLMQVAVGNRAATDERRRPAPESLTVRSKSFAHGAYATTMMGDVCAPLGSILWCCVCLLRVPSASDHVCTALRGGQRRRPAPEPNDTKCGGFGDGGTALVALGDARAPSQSCGAASFYLERRARPSTPSLCDPQFCWGRRPIFTGRDTRA